MRVPAPQSRTSNKIYVKMFVTYMICGLAHAEDLIMGQQEPCPSACASKATCVCSSASICMTQRSAGVHLAPGHIAPAGMHGAIAGPEHLCKQVEEDWPAATVQLGLRSRAAMRKSPALTPDNLLQEGRGRGGWLPQCGRSCGRTQNPTSLQPQHIFAGRLRRGGWRRRCGGSCGSGRPRQPKEMTMAPQPSVSARV